MPKSSKNSQLASVRAVADIEIIDAENRSIVQMSNMVGDWNGRLDDELDSKSISQLNHWFSTLPVAASANAGNAKQLMTCSFKYSQLVQAKDGSGAIGAVLKPGTKKIGAQARFKEAENLKSAVNVNLIFNFASQALAQKHLADINERLQAIEQKVEGIQEHLNKERFAKIQTLQERLQIIGKMLRDGEEITKDTLQNLGKSAEEVRALVIHIKSDIAKAHEEIADFDPTNLFGSDGTREKIKKLIENADRLQREYLLGMQCLLMANLILFIKHGGNKEFSLASEIYLSELRSENGAIAQWGRTQKKITLHLSKMKPLFERSTSSIANSHQVERRLGQADKSLSADLDQITLLNNRIQAAQSTQLMLEVVNGKVQRARYLS